MSEKEYPNVMFISEESSEAFMGGITIHPHEEHPIGLTEGTVRKLEGKSFLVLLPDEEVPIIVNEATAVSAMVISREYLTILKPDIERICKN